MTSKQEADRQAWVQQWCAAHGWERLRREGDFWVAWPPGSYSELPVPPEAYSSHPVASARRARRLRTLRFVLLAGHVAYLEGFSIAHTHTPLGGLLADSPLFGWAQGSPAAFLLAVLGLPVFTIAACLSLEALFRNEPALPGSF